MLSHEEKKLLVKVNDSFKKKGKESLYIWWY